MTFIDILYFFVATLPLTVTVAFLIYFVFRKP